MKKRLLLMAAFALACVGSTFAYNVGDYAYNSTQRFKVLGENKVQNGDFSQGRDGWYAEDGVGASAEVWDVVEGVGPNGETVLQSLGSGSPLCNKWQFDPGSYIVSVDVKFLTAGNTSIITGGSTAGTNAIDFFLNTDGNFTKLASSDDFPVVNVATAQYVPAEEWTSLVWYCTIEQGQQLVMHIENLTADFQLTNIAIHEAQEVYDTRVIEKRIAYVRQLMETPDFNVAEAEEAKANLEGIIETIEAMVAGGELDDATQAEDMLNSFESEGVEPFLAVTSQSMKKNTYFQYVEDLTAFPKYNRGNISNGQQIGGFKFVGDNWLHGENTAMLTKQIQGTYTNGAGSVALYSEAMPAGKYFFAADVINAYCDKNYALTYSLESEIKGFVGSDSIDLGVISGNQYKRVFFIGELKEGEPFNVGIYWNDVATQGTRFDITNIEVRGFLDVEEYFNHKTAWAAFLTQWNAATSSRQKVLDLQGDGNYPWVQDSLALSLAQWDPYYNDIIAKGWVDANGEDAGVATTDELNDWALYQGVELYGAPTEEGGEPVRLQYQVVRGYQNASNYVLNTNKPFTDLAEAIDAAKNTRNNGAYGTGDREAYKAAILKAISTITTVRQNTSDATREADAETLAAALEELNTATEAFIASAALTPFLTIDFSNDFEQQEAEDGTLYWAIKGQGGQMEFPDGSVDTSHGNGETGSATAGYNWTLGHGEELLDMLRVGSSTGTVNVPVEVGDDEAIRIQLDLWIGYLNKCNTWIELKNANGDVVASLMRNNSNGTSETTFGLTADEINKYMTTRGNSSTSNVAIVVDANKTSVDMTIDYKNKTQKLTLVNGNAGTLDAPAVALSTAEVETTNEEGETITVPFDNKVTQLVVRSNYSSQKNNDRRSWMDNVQMCKFKVNDLIDDITESPWADGIETVTVAPAAKVQGVYTLSGVRVSGKNLPAGLYIINGKKVVVK